MTDPIREQRRQVDRWAAHARRVGFALLGLAVVVVLLGAIDIGWDGWATAAVALLVVGSVVLLPGIILGYATRAAERHDRELGL